MYMDRDQSSLDRISKAQKRRTKIDEKERRQKRKERKAKAERQEPKFYDFMADVRSATRVQKMPSWTQDELSLWADVLGLGDGAIAEPGMVERGVGRPPEGSITVETATNPAENTAASEAANPAISELADAIVRSITAATVTQPPPVQTAKGPTAVKPEPFKQQLPVDPIIPTPVPNAQIQCAIRPIPGKGLGVIATTNILQGQAIITESPFLTVDHPPHTQQVVSRLSRLCQRSQDLFHSFKPTLAPYHPNRLIDIVATNVIPLGGDLLEDLDDEVIAIDVDGEVEDRCRSGLFETICRVNHSCEPNAQWTWFESGSMGESSRTVWTKLKLSSEGFTPDHKRRRNYRLLPSRYFTGVCRSPTSSLRNLAIQLQLLRLQIICTCSSGGR